MVNREDRVLAGPEKAPSTASLTLHRKRSACDRALPPKWGQLSPITVALKLLLPEENLLANPAPEASRSPHSGDGFSPRVQGHLAMWSRARVMMVVCLHTQPRCVRGAAWGHMWSAYRRQGACCRQTEGSQTAGKDPEQG